MSKAEAKYAELIDENKFKAQVAGTQETMTVMDTQVGATTSGNGNSGTGNDGGRTSTRKKIPAWIMKAPTDGKLHKVVDGKDYWWCTGHGSHKSKWCRHKPEDCKGLKDKVAEDNHQSNKTPPKSESGAEEKKKTVGWTATMMATLMGSDSEDDE